MTDGARHTLDAAQLTRLRHAVLGRGPDDAGDPDAEHRQSEGELRHAGVSPNGLIEVLASWTSSEEFLHRWPLNPLFRHVQGVDHLDRLDPALRPVVHVHIPKTAGTSLNEAITSHLGPNDFIHSRPIDQLLAMPIARLFWLRFIAGHHGFSGADLLRQRDPLVVSMAREPVDMYASMWRYYRKLDLIPSDMSLERWLRERAKPNIQSRQFLLHLLDGDRGDPRDSDPVDARRTEAMIADALPAALERLHLLAPTEHAAELYLEIHRTVQLPGPPVEFPRLNTTEPAPVSDEAKELIHGISRVDRRFYDAAVQRWAAR